VAGKFDVTSIPGTNDPGVSTLDGRNVAVSPFTKNKATALEFIKFSTSEEAGTEAPGSVFPRPVHASLFEDHAVVAKRPFFPTLLKSLSNAQPRPKVVQYGATTLPLVKPPPGRLAVPDARRAEHVPPPVRAGRPGNGCVDTLSMLA
jgi:multiple sugar transport system substrate-binding protein